MDREIWPDKMKYEEKNYDLTVQAMKKLENSVYSVFLLKKSMAVWEWTLSQLCLL